MNRALGRTGLVTDGGPPVCPRCGVRLTFATDSQGRTTETCGCGYRAFVAKRGGATEPGTGTALPGSGPSGTKSVA